jgi:peptidoglycan/xylan/chitin deacetylase (PgdA/CDA1 family)
MTRGPRASASAQAEIALTFDDGPHPEHTPRLLDVLGAAGAKGTFFVIGEHTLRHPKLVRRIADEGHDIGNHTWTHSEPSRTPASRFLAEVIQTRQIIQNLTGRDCRLMRPPKGSLSVGKMLGLWRQKQTIALWNNDPKDFAMTDESQLLRWLDDYHPRTGDIVLMHDNHARAAVAVERLTRTNLRFVTLSD